MTVAARLSSVQQRIERACLQAGRQPSDVSLLGASKTVHPALIREAMEAGLNLLGESRAQELRDKWDQVGRDATWHFIGRLQRNKVRLVVNRTTLIHTVDSEALAREIQQKSKRTAHVLVQINLDEAPNRGGVAPGQALPLCRAIHQMDGIEVRGLMAVPPWTESVEDTAPWFQRVADLAAEGRADGLPLSELSMGMSRDLEVAIAHGATIVRVGSALFGARAP